MWNLKNLNILQIPTHWYNEVQNIGPLIYMYLKAEKVH